MKSQIDLNAVATNLYCEDGIWFAQKKEPISYPEDGSENSFSIEEKSFWFRHRNDCILTLCKKYLEGGVLFDVGGGNGFVSLALQNAGLDAVVVEPGMKGILQAKRRNLNSLICASFSDAGFHRNSLPAVGLFDVLEHIEYDEVFLKEIHQTLKPDGKLLFTVPAYRFLWSHEDKLGGHFRRYTLSHLNRILETTGFRINYQSYIFAFLPVPIFIFRTLPNLFGLGKNGKHRNDHTSNFPFLKRVLAWELKQIELNRRIPFGGSCLVVASKTS
jgi:SAM-dependent methyltransferase